MKKRFEWNTDSTAAEFLRKLDAHLSAWVDEDTNDFRNRMKFIQDLWFLISAQRGPDTGDWFLKQQTTALIRSLTLPRVASFGGADVKDHAPTSIDTVSGDRHFMDHARFAFIRLGYDVVDNDPASENTTSLSIKRISK